jgi:hypothetical protein
MDGPEFAVIPVEVKQKSKPPSRHHMGLRYFRHSRLAGRCLLLAHLFRAFRLCDNALHPSHIAPIWLMKARLR